MRRLFLIGCLVVVPAVWLAYGVLAGPVANRLAAKWGPTIVQAGDGKFSDAAAFLQNRFLEGAELLTLTAVTLASIVIVGTIFERRLPTLWRWVPYSVAGFVGMNLWVKFAAATCVFWCAFWNGKGTTDNFTQFHIKRLLMNENRARAKAVFGGSSQVRAEIDHRLLNERFGTNIFSTELHFPGNHGYDFLFLDRSLAQDQADVIVCYVSELNFFSSGLSAGFSLFFDFRDLPEFLRLGGQAEWDPRQFGFGLLGSALPVFRLRDPIAQRLLGNGVSGVEQRGEISSLTADLSRRGREAALGYRAGPQSEFEMAAFEQFVAECHVQNRIVAVCCGQLNPLLGEHIEPALRQRMLAFLRELPAKYDNVVVLDEKELPRQTVADYEDLTHVNREAQVRFTEAMGDILQKLADTRVGLQP